MTMTHGAECQVCFVVFTLNFNYNILFTTVNHSVLSVLNNNKSIPESHKMTKYAQGN